MRRGVARSVLALAIAWTACEAALRAAETVDADGQVRVAGVALPPHPPPLAATAESIARYRARVDPFLVYDPDLGWAPRPGARSRDGNAQVGTAGERVASASERAASGAVAGAPAADAPGARAARPIVEIFGDSFTFGDEASFAETWGALLERALGDRGLDARVLNFGVNAYGIDQAYLRWRKVGRALRPAVVVLGLQPENALRNLNVFRPLYFGRTEIPLSKPRFVLAGDGLDLVNSPALPPDGVETAIAHLDAHPLGPHEAFFDAGAARRRWWHASRVLGLLAVAAGSGASGDLDYATIAERHGAFELTRRLVVRFAAEVEADGARFVVVLLPRREEILQIASGAPTWDLPLVAALAPAVTLVEPARSFPPLEEGDFRPAGHYGARLHAIVAQALGDPVARALRAAAP